MATNQEGPMTPGTHADLVARLRDEADNLARYTKGTSVAVDTMREASNTLAALPPPADPPHDCEAWRLEGLGCARCNKADPPALVALVREIGHIRARTLEATCPDCDGPACDHGKAYDPISQIVAKALAASAVDLVAVENAEAELLAYPLPAAPPAPEPQAMPPIEVGDVARLDGFGLVTVNRPEEAGVLSLGIDGLVAVYKPVWTREPRR